MGVFVWNPKRTIILNLLFPWCIFLFQNIFRRKFLLSRSLLRSYFSVDVPIAYLDEPRVSRVISIIRLIDSWARNFALYPHSFFICPEIDLLQVEHLLILLDPALDRLTSTNEWISALPLLQIRLWVLSGLPVSASHQRVEVEATGVTSACLAWGRRVT